MKNADAAGEGNLVRADDLASASAEAPEASEAGGPDDTFDLEVDGQVHTLPAALKGAFLRQADYTRKTQELAEHRRALVVERQTAAAQIQAAGQASHDQVRLAALDHQLSEFGGVDWQAYAAQDPHGAQALWGRFQAMAQARDGLARALAHHAERGELRAAREAAEKMAETGRALHQEIDGWSPEVAAKLVDYARAFGVTNEELAQMADPRLWKLLHKAYHADQASRGEGASSAAVLAQAVRPAVLVSGSAAGGSGVRDELGTKEWMKRRNEIVRKGH